MTGEVHQMAQPVLHPFRFNPFLIYCKSIDWFSGTDALDAATTSLCAESAAQPLRCRTHTEYCIMYLCRADGQLDLHVYVSVSVRPLYCAARLAHHAALFYPIHMYERPESEP